MNISFLVCNGLHYFLKYSICLVHRLFSLLNFLFHSLSNCFYSLISMLDCTWLCLLSAAAYTHSKYLSEFSESHSTINNTFILSALEPTLCFAFDRLAGLALSIDFACFLQ